MFGKLEENSEYVDILADEMHWTTHVIADDFSAVGQDIHEFWDAERIS